MNQIRKYPLFSACGLNCGLCPRYYTDGDSKCPGCGGKNFFEKHPSCGVLSCSQRNVIEYCFLCKEYPCKKYDKWEKDSFITHQNMMKDLEKAKNIGINEYKKELNEKTRILNDLLVNYNDGKRKNIFCIAVNLLEVNDLKDIMKQIKKGTKLNDLTMKEKSNIAIKLLEKMAKEKDIVLKLNK